MQQIQKERKNAELRQTNQKIFKQQEKHASSSFKKKAKKDEKTSAITFF